MEIKQLHKKYIDYWDNWHWYWYYQSRKFLSSGYIPQPDDLFSLQPPHEVFTFDQNQGDALLYLQKTEKIKNGWGAPFRDERPAIGKDEVACWKFFPMPYWGIPYHPSCKAIFLRLNHQFVKDEQNIVLGAYDRLFNAYIKYNKKFHYTVKSLLPDPTFISNRMYQIDNHQQASCLIQLIDNVVEVKTDEVIQFYIVPWVTCSPKEINTNYIVKNSAIIFNKVLKPLAKMSAEIDSPLKGVILMRWNGLNKIDFPQFKLKHFDEQIPPEKEILDRLKCPGKEWRISYFKIEKATFVNFIFHGGDSFPKNTRAMIDAIEYAKASSN